jgi:hypothetical protein
MYQEEKSVYQEEKSVYYIWEINVFNYFKLQPMKKTVIKIIKKKTKHFRNLFKIQCKKTKCMAYTILN